MPIPRRLVALALSLACLPLTPAAPPAWPAVTHETRPWTRWWWLGNITHDEDLRTLIAEYAAAGLGGLEVTPIYGARGREAEFVPFLSPTFVERLKLAAAEAARHGMAIDMSTGTGWPFGGPWVDDSMASRYLAHRAFTLEGGARLEEPVVLEQAPVLRFAGPRREPIERIRRPVTDNPDLQDLAIDQVRFPGPLPLHVLMAYPTGGGEPIDLTARVGQGGRLDWTAPAEGAPWTLHAAFLGWHGKMVERAGPGGEGMAIDHFSRDALTRYLAPFDAALGERVPPGFRAWFNDSYEVDDAQGEADFTARFFEEFERRRGYDLRHHLPKLIDPDAGDDGARVLCDHRETISDLLLEEFTHPWRAWAHARGAIVRNQAHGSPANIIDLYAASDIPETEGSDILQFKTASSAAHLAGRRLASAEALTWLDEHWLSSLGDAKRAIDGFFLGGINHICYHGTAYSPPGDTWPGFQFYAAVEFSPANPLWEHLPALNHYVTRAQSFLQSGEADEDVLVYYTIHDRWSRRGAGAMPHFHGAERDGMSSHATGRALLDAGYAFDFVTDRLLAAATVEDGVVRIGHGSYRAVVVPPARVMPVETLERLLVLAGAGVAVIFEGAMPEDVPGLGRLEELRARWRAAMAQAEESRVVVTADPVAALRSVRAVRREAMVEQGLQFVRRRASDATIYFVVNGRESTFSGWAPLATGARSAVLFDPLTGDAGRARVRRGEGGRTEVRLDLAPGQSMVVRARPAQDRGDAWTYWLPAGAAEPVTGAWSLTFLRGGPTLPDPLRLDAPQSWTGLGGDATQAFSGVAAYEVAFSRPAGRATAYMLDLGDVAVSARVVLNGRNLGVSFDAPHRLVVPASLLAEHNTLRVEVANLAANRIAHLDRRGEPWKKFYNVNMPAWRRENRGPDGLFTAAHWEPRASGLLGPVTLTPLRAE